MERSSEEDNNSPNTKFNKAAKLAAPNRNGCVVNSGGVGSLRKSKKSTTDVPFVSNMQQMQLKNHHQRHTSIGGNGSSGDEETCRFPKLQECAHFHYERVQLGPLQNISLQINTDDFSKHTLQHSSRKYIVFK